MTSQEAFQKGVDETTRFCEERIEIVRECAKKQVGIWKAHADRMSKAAAVSYYAFLIVLLYSVIITVFYICK